MTRKIENDNEEGTIKDVAPPQTASNESIESAVTEFPLQSAGTNVSIDETSSGEDDYDPNVWVSGDNGQRGQTKKLDQVGSYKMMMILYEGGSRLWKGGVLV